jgi:drug/metabolite transporter (DMT)-like permease
VTLLYIAPALVTLGGAAWLAEPLTAAKVAALVLSFAGVVLVSRAWKPSALAGSPAGVAWIIVAAVAYAGYSMFGKRLVGRLAAPTVLAWYLLFGTLGLLVAKLLVSPGSWPPPRELLAISLAMGLLTTLLPTSLYLFALTRLPSSEASILAAIEPVVAVGLAALVLGERLDPMQALGAAMVVSAVLLLNLRRGTAARPAVA